MVKNHLAERSVRYTLKDLSTDREAQQAFLRAGFLLPPVLVVGDEAVAGYDPERIDALLDGLEDDAG